MSRNEPQPIIILPYSIRSRLFFEVASEMMGASDWPYLGSRMELWSQTGESGIFRLYGANHPDSLQEMAEGRLDISILNPSAMLTMAYRGTGPFEKPIPVATIAVLPHYDQLGFAVTEKSGLRSLDEIREQRYPLRVSVRDASDLCTTQLVDVVLKAHGFSLEDLVSWGGHISYDQLIPNDSSRIDRVKSGELDAIFEEGIILWGKMVSEAGMRFLPIDDEHLTRLEAEGFRRATIKKALYPTLPTDIPTVDFGGWPIFTHLGVSDLLVQNFCEALEARKQQIQWYVGPAKQPPLPLERMCKDSEDTPFDVPLHPVAERFWRARGYL